MTSSITIPDRAVTIPDRAVTITEMRKDNVRLHQGRLTAGAKPATANRVLIMMRYMFKQASRWEVPGVKANPCANAPLLEENNKHELFLTANEAKQLYEAVCASPNQMLRYIVPLLILTGARKREPVDAKWEDFDLGVGCGGFR